MELKLGVLPVLGAHPNASVGPAATVVSFTDVYCRPRPTRLDGVPIVVGGHSRASVRRAARFRAGWYPLGVDSGRLGDLLTLLRAECASIGRDADEIEITARAPGRRDEVERLRALGVSRVVIRADPSDPVGVRDKVRRYQQQLLVAN